MGNTRDKRVALHYSSTALTSLTWNNTATEQLKFYTLSFVPPYVNTVVDTGRTLNGKGYSNTLYKYKEYELIISADELSDTNNQAFINSFYSANYKYISIYNGTTWSSYIEVMTDGGKIPLEYLDGLEYFPELKIKLTAVEPF